MPESPAPSSRSVSSLQRWQSFRNVAGCMGAFSHIFHWNIIVGGSSSYLETSDACQAHYVGSKCRGQDAEKQISLRGQQAEESVTSIDLRRILDAQQEPFVLQDVIWEKKHPMRSRSSRELKFDFNDPELSAKKPQKPKREKSRDRRKHSDVGGDGGSDFSALSHISGGTSTALGKGSNAPAESLAGLPSKPVSLQTRKTCSSSSKMPSSGKSPVKSPNKKALLMEAAAKILEGCNRRASKLSSNSARSLLKDFDGSKQARELSKSKEAPPKKDSFGVECSATQKSPLYDVATLDQMQVENKQPNYSNGEKSFSFVNQLLQDSSNSLSSSSEKTDDEVLMIMQSRLHRLDEVPAVRGEFTLPAMTGGSDVPDQSNHVQGPATSIEEEISISLFDVSMEGMHRSADSRTGHEQTCQEVGFGMVIKIIERNHGQPDRDILIDRSKGLESVPCGDSSNTTFNNELPTLEFVNPLEWDTLPKKLDVEISEDLHQLPMSGEVPIGDIGCGLRATSSGSCQTTIENVDCVHAYTFMNTDPNMLTKSFTTSTCDIFSEGLCSEVDLAENAPTPVLLLCNYSWWTPEGIQAHTHSPTLKNETSSVCVGYESPDMAIKGRCDGKIFEKRQAGENLEEDSSSTSPDHSHGQEFQQSSPVSVLDAVYDDNDPVLEKPFDYFDEARQKLLESVRRYEMLAHMDLDTLIKINEESLCHDLEEESDSSILEESLESNVTDICATRQQMPLMGSPDYQLPRYGGFSNAGVEGLSLDGAFGSFHEDDLYSHSDEELYMQQLHELADEENLKSTSDFMMDVRARFETERESRQCKAFLDSSTEPSDLYTSKERHWQLSRTNSSRRTTSKDMDKLNCLVVINAVLHIDLTTSSWSSFHEEIEVMKMELESSLFAAIMQELLSDLVDSIFMHDDFRHMVPQLLVERNVQE